ncbi:MAG TPA: hypothetical protein VMV94_10440 [Phycisphaerae bacterium]|nr:hypothetical protein [Phycisphaerae bacterium]
MAYWGLGVLNPFELDVIFGSPWLFRPLHSAVELRPLLLVPVLVGAFLLVQPVPGLRDASELLQRAVMVLAAACTVFSLALQIGIRVVLHADTISFCLIWGRQGAEGLFAVAVMLYMGHLATRFDRKDIARLAGAIACMQLILVVMLFAIEATAVRRGVWFGTIVLPSLAHVRLYFLVRMIVRLVVWILTLAVLWKFGSVIDSAVPGKRLCCGYPTRDLISNKCPECGANCA